MRRRALSLLLRGVGQSVSEHRAPDRIWSAGGNAVHRSLITGRSSLHGQLKLERMGFEWRKEFDNVVGCMRAAQKEFARARAPWEARTVAFSNSLTLSNSGQQILGLGTPLLAASHFTPKWGSCSSLAALPVHLTHNAAPATSPHPIAGLLHELSLWLRAAYLCLIFTPALVLAPICLQFGIGRDWWMELVTWTLERAGPAFIKWGQWSATRPDLFPVDLCRSLEQLHHNAPSHSFTTSKKEVEGAFGMKLEDIFCEFEEEPIASGSIAQIHKARLNTKLPNQLGGAKVAVKVRHPGVNSILRQDFELMIRACRMASHLPGLSELRLEESIRQFQGPMQEQLDLTMEARNLQRFISNFKWWSNVSFPTPLYPLVQPSVLVETFEEGDSITRFVRQPDGLNSVRISQIGLDLYLKMLVSDNFVHADLHPGNILIRTAPDLKQTWIGWVRKQLNWGPNPELVLVDAGMVTELTPHDQSNVVGFFQALTQRDGADIAQSILSLSEQPFCPNPSAFVEDMKLLFDDLDIETIRKYSAKVIRDMLEKVRTHQVNLKGSVSTLVATTLVLEGWSTKLNPDISIIDQISEALPKDSDDRMVSTLEKIVAMGSVAEL